MAEPIVPRIRVPHPHVRVDASVLGGSPHVNGSRVPVRRLWAWHRGGAAVETLVKRYPNLGPARILDALAFAYDNQDLIEADLEREQTLFAAGGSIVGARPLSQLVLPFDGSEQPLGLVPAPSPAAPPSEPSRPEPAKTAPASKPATARRR